MKHIFTTSRSGSNYFKKAFFFFVFLVLTRGMYAQTSTFYVSSGNWSSPANWTNGVPTATTNALISDGAVCTVDVAGAQCASLSFAVNSMSCSLQLSATASLSVSGAISFSAPGSDGASQTLAVGAGLVSCGSVSFADCANGDCEQTT